jgi:hypothetical protein
MDYVTGIFGFAINSCVLHHPTTQRVIELDLCAFAWDLRPLAWNLCAFA